MLRGLAFKLFFFVGYLTTLYGAEKNVFASSDTVLLIKQNIRQGNEYYKRSNFIDASKQFFNALRLAEKINDSLHIGLANNNIAIIYHETDKLDEAKNIH